MDADRNIYLSNMELTEAAALLAAAFDPSFGSERTEWVPVPEALDRVTAQAVFARLSAPNYNASAMDGIAVRAADTFGATERNPVRLLRGEGYQGVDTGDPILDPWDAVVMIEEVEEAWDGSVLLRAAVSPWQHVRPVGEDVVAGELILPAFHRITPIDLGALLSGGLTALPVLKKPRVAILPTGTEIVEPGSPMVPGAIIESNSRVFEAEVRQCGGEPLRLTPVPDDYGLIRETVRQAAQDCDLVVINAGSSAGTEDFTAAVIGELGEVLVHGIAIKPGKPAILGRVDGKPVIGIPGYPVSAWVVFDALVKPLIHRLLHRREPGRPTAQAVVSRRIVSSLKHLEFVRVKLGDVGGRLIATPLNRGAGVTMSLVRADGILPIPLESEGVEAGETVSVQLLRDLEAIRNTVVVIGSHDLAVDLLGDCLHTAWPEGGLSSAHVGSMAGLMALHRGEAHVAPIHLLDEATGEYNRSVVRRALPQLEAVLVQGVRRIQGLMVPRGNPRDIKGLEDLAAPGLRFVNRQRGSGTRILLDYHLKRMGLSADALQGYQREMTTHMAVASAVASGSADAGLGIQSAAEILGLDFIPIGVESYDFLVPKVHLETLPVQKFIQVLGSEAFREKLMAVPGYELEAPGTLTAL